MSLLIDILVIVAAFMPISVPQPIIGAADSNQHIYMIAGTLTISGPQAYPVTLYRAGSNKKLIQVRTLVGAADGAASILGDAQGNFYVAFPHLMPASLSILHVNSAEIPDRVDIDNNGSFVLTSAGAVSEKAGDDSYYLVPVNAGDRLRNDLSLVSVRGRREGASPRVGANEWFRYQDLHMEGQTGGGEFSSELTGHIHGSIISLTLGPRRVMISNTLPQHTDSWDGRQVSIVAADARYFIFSLTRTRAQMEAGSLAPRLLYVCDKNSGRWRSLSLPSDSPAVRLSGSWIASISEFYDPENKDNPGRENERASRTALLPDVRGEYAELLGSQYRIPGILTLDNLEDGRRIALNTGQEDSEILAVLNGNEVFYRVNDSVFKRTIVGSALGEPQLVVKGDDVPEIHWIYMAPS